MRYQLLGRSGLRVSELALGTMTFGEDWGWGSSPEECGLILDAFSEAGGNLLDTANKYTDGSSESIVGGLVAGRRGQFVLSTKYTLSTDPTDVNAGGSHRKNLRRSLEASLRRLGTDYVDLYWVHIWDPLTPAEETMRALDDAVRAGKILHVGISDAPAWVVAHANTLAELRGWTAFIGLQVPYNLVQRDAERDLLPMADAFGLTTLAWSPLAGGLLSGKHTGPAAQRSGSRLERARLGDRELGIATATQQVAEAIGASPAQVALAWIRQRVRRVIPIVGARRPGQLKENMG